MSAPGGRLIRMLPPLLDLAAALTPSDRDDLHTGDAFRPRESPKAQAAERDAAERSVAPQIGLLVL